jgi:hypothetical protein
VSGIERKERTPSCTGERGSGHASREAPRRWGWGSAGESRAARLDVAAGEQGKSFPGEQRGTPSRGRGCWCHGRGQDRAWCWGERRPWRRAEIRQGAMTEGERGRVAGLGAGRGTPGEQRTPAGPKQEEGARTQFWGGRSGSGYGESVRLREKSP